MSGLPENIAKPPLHVLHAELERVSEDSAYKSVCPACKGGLLAVHRVMGSVQGHVLLRHDRCFGCGQQVVYQDRTINGELLYPVLGGEA
jgi:hypothetical protein